MNKFGLSALLILLTACIAMPDLGTNTRQTADDRISPRILPVEGLIIQALGPAAGGARSSRALDGVTSDLTRRISRLKARAAILRGAAVDKNTRDRLSGT